MRICLLTNQDLDRATLAEDDWPCDPRPFYPADWDVLVLEKETAVREVTRAARRGYDLFFNLCDGAWDEGTPGIEVVLTLERLSVPFTGATSDFYEPSREAMKRVCRAWGLHTPDYAFVRDDRDIDLAARELRFPLFVKHPSSYASIGITRDSRVETREELEEQAHRTIASWGGALVEEYIEGTEYTVLVAENPDDPNAPIAYQPIGYRFPEGESFKHSDLKWVDYAAMRTFPVDDPELDRALRDATARLFAGLGGSGYGRTDFRVDREGRPFLLEINPNCGLYYEPEDAGSADLCLLADPRGHEGFTRTVIETALARHARQSRPWRVVPMDGGYGMIADRDLDAGDCIIAFEGEPHRLVTRSYVEAEWTAEDRASFYRYAWPLTDETWVTWSRDPERWMPVNHGCDPNAWLEGLDVVARRPIAKGEEITLDYATFYNERMPSFTCRCGASECRGLIRGSDLLEPFVERYGTHVSDYVRRRRERAETLAGT
ncbi:MAG: SET domain-containing protein-lysine N-methyltransferase [Gemmatimonadota bacterium]|nr:SET domain-containing protein-lysine N-methyltransferase [Gemmatimonadota bacterium]